MIHGPDASQDGPCNQDSQEPEPVGVAPPRTAVFPIVLNEADEGSALPPRHGFAGVVALSDFFRIDLGSNHEAWRGLHRQIDPERAITVDHLGDHQIEPGQGAGV